MATSDLSPTALAWQRVRAHRVATVSMVVVALIALACAAAPLLAPADPEAIDLGSLEQAPSAAHWMGTDELGRDVLSRVLYGGRISILIGVLAATLGTGMGTLIGSIAGYRRRRSCRWWGSSPC